MTILERPPRWQTELAALPLTFEGAWHATYRDGDKRARLRFEPGGCIHVRVAAHSAGPAARLLRHSAGLPGNARFAGPPGQRTLVADHLAPPRDEQSEPDLGLQLSTLIGGLTSARRRGARRRGARQTELTETVDASREPNSLAEKIAQMERGTMSRSPLETVQLDDGWEFRPRIAGHAIAIRATAVDQGLDLSHVLATEIPGGHRCRAVVDHALRCNARIRFARLELREGSLAAATHCSAGTARELEHAIRAVAAAAWHCADLVAALIEHPDVAHRYVRILTPNRTPTPENGEEQP